TGLFGIGWARRGAGAAVCANRLFLADWASAADARQTAAASPSRPSITRFTSVPPNNTRYDGGGCRNARGEPPASLGALARRYQPSHASPLLRPAPIAAAPRAGSAFPRIGP